MKTRLLLCMLGVLTASVVAAQDVFPEWIELSQEERSMVKGSNDFALRLFDKARETENMVMSPLSVTYALGLLNNGAVGETQEEINNVLGFGETGADGINRFCHKLMTKVSELDPKTKMMIANTVFFNSSKGCELKEDFVEKASMWFDCVPEARNFYDGQTMNVINKWASDHTQGMIPQVLNEQSFNPDAVSYLLNAIYFKGTWTLKFDKAETKDEPFDGGEEVPMMHLHKDMEYGENDVYQMLTMPYGNTAYQMTVFLPRQGKGIGDVMDYLKETGIEKAIRSAKMREADVKFPRFETDTNINLVNIMNALGVKKAFTEQAEFPDFCTIPTLISRMFQVAKIKLDEEGTEAAAVTVIVADVTSVDPMIPEPPVVFHADHPFIYVITEQSTGVVFFIGQYVGKGFGASLERKEWRVKSEANVIYDLTGRRLDTMQKGVNIVNGKKVMVKH